MLLSPSFLSSTELQFSAIIDFWLVSHGALIFVRIFISIMTFLSCCCSGDFCFILVMVESSINVLPCSIMVQKLFCVPCTLNIYIMMQSSLLIYANQGLRWIIQKGMGLSAKHFRLDLELLEDGFVLFFFLHFCFLFSYNVLVGKRMNSSWFFSFLARALRRIYLFQSRLALYLLLILL